MALAAEVAEAEGHTVWPSWKLEQLHPQQVLQRCRNASGKAKY